MGIVLTNRMREWIKTGCHLNVADKKGVPHVTISRKIDSVSDDEVIFVLTRDEYSVIQDALLENPWAAFGVSGVGSIRYCYQFKGTGKIREEGDNVYLTVKLSEIYCTKPGCYAGLRLDQKSPEGLEAWEKELWTDLPKKK